MKKLVISFLLFAFISCKKEPALVCYTCSDTLGNDLGEYCGENEQDAYNQSSGTFNGLSGIEGFRASCRKQ